MYVWNDTQTASPKQNKSHKSTRITINIQPRDCIITYIRNGKGKENSNNSVKIH